MNESLENRIVYINQEKLSWDFADKFPHFKIQMPGAYSSSIKLDPFPCYAHNWQLVAEIAAKCEQIFPLKYKPYYYVSEYETSERTNGHQGSSTISYDEKPYPYRPYVFLAGKRIPPMQAVGKYLVSHEYSHCVQQAIQFQRRIEREQFDEEYAKFRGIEFNTSYGARKWHSNSYEICCNDIRICIFGFESDFWPHDCPPPNHKIYSYWQEMREKYSFRDNV